MHRYIYNVRICIVLAKIHRSRDEKAEIKSCDIPNAEVQKEVSKNYAT